MPQAKLLGLVLPGVISAPYFIFSVMPLSIPRSLQTFLEDSHCTFYSLRVERVHLIPSTLALAGSSDIPGLVLQGYDIRRLPRTLQLNIAVSA